MAMAAMTLCLQTKMALATINKKRKTEYSYLKPLQFKSVKAAYHSDAMIVLPTGYGKSLIFEVLMNMNKKRCIIISPLNAIILEQSKRLGSEAIVVDASLISKIKKGSGDILKSRYTYILCHPEDILKKEICDILCSDSWQIEITHIFIDEAHCVVQWGHEFRPDYMKISKLRSVFPDAKFVALTATATKLMIKEITDILQMKSFTTISACVDRPNVQITVIKRLPSAGGKNTAEESFKQVMEPVVRSLCNDAENFPKTIMYSKLKWCGNGYNMVCQEAAKESDPNAVIHRVSQYHSACTDQMKKIIVDDMANVNGNISLLFATEAYGMGADAPNIRRIIHYGPPTSIETYMQEIGRAGRDGLQSEAVLYFNNNDLGSNTPVRDEVKQFCRLKSCRRQFLCEHFDWECVASLIKHNCCDICKIDCNCIDCLSNSAFDDIDVAEDDIEDTPSQLQSLLAAYFQLENDLVAMPKSEIFTGLSSELVHMLVKHCLSYKSSEEICREFPFLKFEYACNIFKIILNVKSECPEV